MARKSNSRRTNVKIKMEGRPPPDDPDSSSMPDLQESFAALTIGARRKENVNSNSSKEDEISLEEDHDFQDGDFLEKWNSLDRITIDGSESSDWERSVSSSMSWFDESEQEATLKVKSMLDNIENMLYGDIHTPLPKLLVEECNQWRQRFPHLRVVGTGLRNCINQETEDLSNSDNDSPPTGAESLDYSREQAGKIQEEGEEEVYASHGTLEIQPALAHEFQHHHEPIKDPETERIKELLLDELTMHVWKEVVKPTLKPFMDKHIGKKDDIESSRGEGEPCGASATKNQRDVQDVKVGGTSASLYLSQQSTSLSAREMRTVFNSSSDLDDPFECYRRYSEQFTYCDSKFSDDFRSLETVKELKQCGSVKKELQKWRNFSRSPWEGCRGRLSCGDDSEQSRWKRNSSRGERLQFPSPRAPRRVGVVEELKPLEKSNAWVSSKSEGLQYSGKYLPPKQTRHLTLPAIEHGNVLPNVEVSSIHHGRASSALPKIVPKNCRPTMSSYQNKIESKGAIRKNHHSKYNEADPLEAEVEVIHKNVTRNPGFNSGQPNNIQGNKTRQNKQRKRRKSNRTQNMDCDHS